MAPKVVPTYTTGKVFAASRLPDPRKWVVISCCLVAVLLIVMFTMRGRKAPQVVKPTPVLTVTVEPVSTGTAIAQVPITGSISAIDPLTIGAETSGLEIVSVPVEQGMYVRRGAVLAQLDSALLRAQLAAARARLSGAQASTSKAIQPNRPEDIASAQQAVQQAQAQAAQQRALLAQAQSNYQNAQRAAQRYQQLAQQGAVSQQDAENETNTARTAQAQVDAAKAAVAAANQAANEARERMLLTQQGGSAQDVAIARANAADIAAQVRQLEVQIGQTVIRAPDDGLITKRNAHIGDITSPGKTLFEMTRRGQLELQAQVPQRDLQAVHTGNTSSITDGTRTTSGIVWQVAPTVDPGTRLGTVRISLPLNSGFMPGMFARGSIQTGTQNLMQVPAAAVLNDGANDYIFLYDNGFARKRPVVVGAHLGAETQLMSGVKVGDPIIVAGAGFLNDGDAVRVGK